LNRIPKKRLALMLQLPIHCVIKPIYLLLLYQKRTLLQS